MNGRHPIAFRFRMRKGRSTAAVGRACGSLISAMPNKRSNQLARPVISDQRTPFWCPVIELSSYHTQHTSQLQVSVRAGGVVMLISSYRDEFRRIFQIFEQIRFVPSNAGFGVSVGVSEARTRTRFATHNTGQIRALFMASRLSTIHEIPPTNPSDHQSIRTNTQSRSIKSNQIRTYFVGRVALSAFGCTAQHNTHTSRIGLVIGG